MTIYFFEPLLPVSDEDIFMPEDFSWTDRHNRLVESVSRDLDSRLPRPIMASGTGPNSPRWKVFMRAISAPWRMPWPRRDKPTSDSAASEQDASYSTGQALNSEHQQPPGKARNF